MVLYNTVDRSHMDKMPKIIIIIIITPVYVDFFFML